jgi:transposase
VEIFHNGNSIAVHPRNFRSGRYSTLREHMPANHQFVKDINPDRLIQWASSIGPQTAELVRATLQSRPFPQQAYRSCLGILSLAKKYSQPLMEQACQALLEAKVFSSKAVQQELIHLKKLIIVPTEIKTLPTHENIRGAEYYQESQLP